MAELATLNTSGGEGDRTREEGPAGSARTPSLGLDVIEFGGQDAKIIVFREDENTGHKKKIEYPAGEQVGYIAVALARSSMCLQGKVSMQKKNGEISTLMSGHAFYEAPGDSHLMMWNASKTLPAEFVVFLISGRDDPLLLAAN